MRPLKPNSGDFDTTDVIVSPRPRGEPPALARGDRPSGDPWDGFVGRVTMFGYGPEDARTGDTAGAPPCGVAFVALSKCFNSASTSNASAWLLGEADIPRAEGR